MNSSADDTTSEYGLTIAWCLARWIEDHRGKGVLEKIAREVGVKAEDFDGSAHWVSHEQLELFFKRARELANSDEEFRAILSHRFTESYGAFKYMVWAVSRQTHCEIVAKMASKVITKVSTFETLKSERNRFWFRYHSTKPESRLLCVSRLVGWSMGPTIYGLPRADVTEHACIARGDPYCEYHVQWFERSRLAPIIAGAIIGLVLAYVLGRSPPSWLLFACLPIAGAAIAYAMELARTTTLNLKFAQDMNEALRQVGQAEAETRSEVAALHQRQRDWIRIMEGQVVERTSTLEQVVTGLQDLQKSRFVTLRGFSHDIRNPLFVIRGNAQFLLERFKTHGGEESEALQDLEVASMQIETMLSKLMEVATQEPGAVKMTPKVIAVAALAEPLARRLRALVYGRDIKISVFCTREAPEEIVCDQLIFDRIVDNVLTNAAKYTERGSIVLELGRTPGAFTGAPKERSDYLTLKVSDTGCGIEAADVDRIFRPRSSTQASTPMSYGVGLSSAVTLLAQIGGRLDVMSKIGRGTTFWVHIPTQVAQSSKVEGEDTIDRMISRVVTVRRESA